MDGSAHDLGLRQRLPICTPRITPRFFSAKSVRQEPLRLAPDNNDRMADRSVRFVVVSDVRYSQAFPQTDLGELEPSTESL